MGMGDGARPADCFAAGGNIRARDSGRALDGQFAEGFSRASFMDYSHTARPDIFVGFCQLTYAREFAQNKNHRDLLLRAPIEKLILFTEQVEVLK